MKADRTDNSKFYGQSKSEKESANARILRSGS